jgi:hypothetical protein
MSGINPLDDMAEDLADEYAEVLPTKKDTRLHIGDVVRFKATGMVAKVSRFHHNGTTDFWADNGTGPYKQTDVEKL